MPFDTTRLGGCKTDHIVGAIIKAIEAADAVHLPCNFVEEGCSICALNRAMVTGLEMAIEKREKEYRG